MVCLCLKVDVLELLREMTKWCDRMKNEECSVHLGLKLTEIACLDGDYDEERGFEESEAWVRTRLQAAEQSSKLSEKVLEHAASDLRQISKRCEQAMGSIQARIVRQKKESVAKIKMLSSAKDIMIVIKDMEVRPITWRIRAPRLSSPLLLASPLLLFLSLLSSPPWLSVGLPPSPLSPLLAWGLSHSRLAVVTTATCRRRRRHWERSCATQRSPH